MGWPSPNHGDRRGQVPDLIVIHYTGMPDCAGARARLCDPDAEVSAHWLIDEQGRAEALVPEDRRAWHAGAGSWRGRDDVNSRSIGIELANPGDRPFPEPQMAALELLLRGVMARWQIGAAGVIGHSDMAPGRKIDPGPRFDWARLARQGLAVWPGQGDDRPLAESLDAIGYPAVDADVRLAAFRLRFRPWARGAEGAGDRRAAAWLGAAAPGLACGKPSPADI
ncbi:MAG: N-acetylmuramoyl-L-alanine amidase [Paracoccus sp. (in: a-proteobacteria)]|uniref:N-acetylmuramoyl-L-alanine amidase n=1 Tax=Paracoccus sp. TaxID=267 RepID=UPI0026E0F9A1|nr:N-acetylmuramoyl-L-alanine amidase [Paracoccus sp. (in: a-proteobacteria)]MDO5614133.1 N-acetylmuramoyl-L-alanine amidase [Paracoccus sp. (in: a-proteobacteria)]